MKVNGFSFDCSAHSRVKVHWTGWSLPSCHVITAGFMKKRVITSVWRSESDLNGGLDVFPVFISWLARNLIRTLMIGLLVKISLSKCCFQGQGWAVRKTIFQSSKHHKRNPIHLHRGRNLRRTWNKTQTVGAARCHKCSVSGFGSKCLVDGTQTPLFLQTWTHAAHVRVIMETTLTHRFTSTLISCGDRCRIRILETNALKPPASHRGQPLTSLLTMTQTKSYRWCWTSCRETDACVRVFPASCRFFRGFVQACFPSVFF